MYTWMVENAEDYGFILRYPKGKEEITKISFESWHYRYVGVEVAMDMKDSGLCLEEYLEIQARQQTMLERVKAALDSFFEDTSRSIFRLMTRRDGGLGTVLEDANVMKP